MLAAGQHQCVVGIARTAGDPTAAKLAVPRFAASVFENGADPPDGIVMGEPGGYRLQGDLFLSEF
jgi:hypothetical protein